MSFKEQLLAQKRIEGSNPAELHHPYRPERAMNARDVASAPPACVAGEYDRQGRSGSHLADRRPRGILPGRALTVDRKGG